MTERWVAYGRVIPPAKLVLFEEEDEEGLDELLEGCWKMVVMGPIHVEGPVAETFLKLPLLTVWDHEPSRTEKEALTPEGWEDE